MVSEASRRPCHAVGSEANPCARAHYERVVYGNATLYGEWQGWRIAGRELVAPDGTRISRRRLEGLMFRDEAEKRIAAARRRSGKDGNYVVRASFGSCA